MKIPIGFKATDEPAANTIEPRPDIKDPEIIESMVLVRFPNSGMPLNYYNDRFALKPGDFVFVEGKFEGVCGRVEKVSTHFKVNLEDYKRVLGVVDTHVRGTFRQVGSFYISLDREALPYNQALSWFKPLPEDGVGEFIRFDDDDIDLDFAGPWPFPREIMDRGHSYYQEDRILYIGKDHDKVRAIVEGSKHYEVEFIFQNGRISGLSCNCPYAAPCKHEVAVLFALREILENLETNDFPERFSAVAPGPFFSFAVNRNKGVEVTLG